MPVEKFWHDGAIEGDAPDLTIRWGEELPAVTINGGGMDRSGLNRLISSLRRARNQTYGIDE